MTDKKKRKKRKIKTYEVPADDYLVEAEDGEQFAPHEGETITLRRDIPWRIYGLQSDDTMRRTIGEILAIIVRQVRAWTLTDEDGEALPKPGTEAFIESLVDMDGDFLWWLWGKILDRGNLPPE